MIRLALVMGLWSLGIGLSSAQVQMPDPSQIHGRAIPAAELPDGEVTVRVVREAIGNNISGQDVSLTSEGRTRTVRTDDQGRALFTNLPLGAQATAQAIVDGEQLTSEPFTVPTRGGLRVILVAGIKAAAERQQREAQEAIAQPAEKGIVVLGPNTRIVAEFQNDQLNVFYILDILNNARGRVDIGGPILIDLPEGASGASPLDGSSTQASINGDRITVTGPFNPGSTMVQLGFGLPNAGSSFRLEQRFPVALQQVTVAFEKVGELAISSPQFSTTGSVTSESGAPFLLANGPALAANSPLVVEVSGLPAHSTVPRYAALAIALGIFGLGGWLAYKGPRHQDVRQRLVARRDSLLGELAQLEERRRAGGETLKQSSRRNRILSELEQIYGELDETSAA